MRLPKQQRQTTMQDKLSMQYNDAVQQIKLAILRSQAKALAGVNQEQLALYYGIGRYISQNTRQGVWGKDAIATISRQLSAEMPGLRGFSATNLRLMRIFYEEWQSLEADSSVTTDELKLPDTQVNEIHQLQLTNYEDFPVAAFMSIGFSHHSLILSRVKTREEQCFYIQLASDLSLTVEALERKIAENAFAHRGNMPNNFSKTIPDLKQAFRAIQMFKDEYLLDYINVEQLGERDEYLDSSSTASCVRWSWSSLRRAPSNPATWVSCRTTCMCLTTTSVWMAKTRPWASSSVVMPTAPLWSTCCRTTNAPWEWPPTRPVRSACANSCPTRKR